MHSCSVTKINCKWGCLTGQLQIWQRSLANEDNHRGMLAGRDFCLQGTLLPRAGLTSKSNQAKGHCPSNSALSFPKADIPQSPQLLSCCSTTLLPPRTCYAASCWLLPFLETAPPPSSNWASTRPNVPLQSTELRTKCDFTWCGYKEGPRDVSSLPGPVLADAIKKEK